MALSSLESKMLGKVIPSQSLGSEEMLRKKLKELMAADKEEIMAQQPLSEMEWKQLQNRTIENVFGFLVVNEFLKAREGEVYYLTEKGKNLRAHGSVEAYLEWADKKRHTDHAETVETMNTGYIKSKQSVVEKAAPPPVRTKLVPIIGVLILVILALAVAHHYKVF